MLDKTTIFYNLLDDKDIMISLLLFDELELFLNKVVGSENPFNYFKQISLN